jgi:hypothetical protein
VNGVATAVAVPNVLFCLFVIGLASKELNVSLGRYSAAWLRPLAVSVVPVVVWLVLGTPAANYADIAVAMVAGLVPFAIGVGLVEFGVRFGRITPSPAPSPSADRIPVPGPP